MIAENNMHRFFLMVALLATMYNADAQVNKEAAVIKVDLAKDKGLMKPIWAWFGYDEPNYTYMKDGKKLLSEIAKLSPVPVYVRAHSLLCTGDGIPSLKWGSTNAYTEDEKGNLFTTGILWTVFLIPYIQRGMKHWRRLGLCPKHCQAIQYHTGTIGNQVIPILIL